MAGDQTGSANVSLPRASFQPQSLAWFAASESDSINPLITEHSTMMFDAVSSFFDPPMPRLIL
jgi:hypothetical protein